MRSLLTVRGRLTVEVFGGSAPPPFDAPPQRSFDDVRVWSTTVDMLEATAAFDGTVQ
jgi:hypothetical protein